MFYNLLPYILMFLSVLIYTVFYIRKAFDIDLKYFLMYLYFISISSIIASYLRNKYGYNLIVFNILIFWEFNCLFFFFKEILESKSTKKKVLNTIYIFNIIYILSNLYFLYRGDFLNEYNLIASISGSVLITIVLFYFFKDLLNSNKILNYKKTLTFWISFGLLVYYIGTIPLTSIMNSMTGISKTLIVYLFRIQVSLSIFIYSCFILGALWSQKKVR